MNPAEEFEERRTARLERELQRQYKQTLRQMLEDFGPAMADFESADKKQRGRVAQGELPQKDYKHWRSRAMNRRDVRNVISRLAERLEAADEESAELIRKAQQDIYTETVNYETYNIENTLNIDTTFQLVNEDTLRRAADEGNLLLPKIDPDKAKAWHGKNLHSVIAQGMMQGKGVPEIARELQRVAGMGKNAAIRNARTMCGAAANGGIYDAGKRAQDLGIKMEKIWMATLDNRTRHSHRHLDLERVPFDDEFSNGLRFPKDMEADIEHLGAEVYNCRCRLLNMPEGIEWEAQDRFGKLDGQTYEEWKNGKQPKKEQKQDTVPIKRKKKK